jgi:CheY-like chemotaxis protein
MYILFVEDDPVQFKFIEKNIMESGEFSPLKIRSIRTESEFRNNFEEIATDNPDVVIMDVMLRWTNPSPNMPIPPKEIKEKGFYRAGIRCTQMLNDDTRTKHIPVIIYSILDKDVLDDEIENLPQAKYLYKDFESQKIIRVINSAKPRRNLPEEQTDLE